MAFTEMLSWSQMANSSLLSNSIPLINRRFLLCRCSSTLPLYLPVVTGWLLVDCLHPLMRPVVIFAVQVVALPPTKKEMFPFEKAAKEQYLTLPLGYAYALLITIVYWFPF